MRWRSFPTLAMVTEKIFSATETMGWMPEKIFYFTKKMVAAAEKSAFFTKSLVPDGGNIFLFAIIMVSLTETVIFVTQNILYDAWTMVSVMKTVFSAINKMLSSPWANGFTGQNSQAGTRRFALSSISGQSSAIPKLVSFWSSSPLASGFSLEIRL
jgi:hypothetical protein